MFGNAAGNRYSKGGWKRTLSYLMDNCAEAAKEAGKPFTLFNLCDCRPGGVTEKLDNNNSDVMDATLHSSDRMMRQHYDRKRTRVATLTK